MCERIRLFQSFIYLFCYVLCPLYIFCHLKNAYESTEDRIRKEKESLAQVVCTYWGNHMQWESEKKSANILHIFNTMPIGYSHCVHCMYYVFAANTYAKYHNSPSSYLYSAFNLLNGVSSIRLSNWNIPKTIILLNVGLSIDVYECENFRIQPFWWWTFGET